MLICTCKFHFCRQPHPLWLPACFKQRAAGRWLQAVLLFFALSVGAREVVIDVLHTADMHGNVFGSGIDNESSINGGLLRCAAMVDKIRAANSNVVLIDCGDLFQGSVESFLTRGQIVADTVKAMRYDGLVVGNHEFDWGCGFFRNFYENIGIKILAADIFIGDTLNGVAQRGATLKPASFNRPPGFSPFFICEFEGVRLAVIGLSNPHMPRWFKPSQLAGFEFCDSMAALRGILPEIRAAKPDILVLAAHQGYRQWGDNPANRINSIAANFPELDVIIGAHSHEAASEIDLNGILYTQSGPYGRNLGKVRLKFDSAARRLLEKRGELLPMTAEIRLDEKLSKKFKQIRKETRAWLDQIIGSAACDHTPQPMTPGQSRIQSLIATAIAGKTGAEIVFHGPLSSSSIYAGNIRMRDIWRVIPYENTIGIAGLTLDEIREILKENSRYFNSTQFRGVYGICYNLDLTDDRNAVALTKISGMDLNESRSKHAGRRYKTAFNSFDLASAGDRLPVLRQITEQPACRLTDTGLDTRQIVIDYVKNHPNFDVLIVPPTAGAVKCASDELKK